MEQSLSTTDVMDYFEDDLYETICKGDYNSMKEYLKRGLDVNHAFRSTDRPDRLGKTLIETAVSVNKKGMVDFLINNNANVNLKYVVDVNNFAYKLREYKKKDHLKLTCIYPCIVKNYVEMIKLLVQGGFDVNTSDDRGCTPLWHAVDLNNYDIMIKIIVFSLKLHYTRGLIIHYHIFTERIVRCCSITNKIGVVYKIMHTPT